MQSNWAPPAAYDSPYYGVKAPGGQFQEFQYKIKDIHKQKGCWIFSPGHETAAYLKGFSRPEEVLFAARNRDVAADNIKISWIFGNGDTWQLFRKDTASVHIRDIDEERSILGLPALVWGEVPTYHLDTDGVLFTHRSQKEAQRGHHANTQPQPPPQPRSQSQWEPQPQLQWEARKSRDRRPACSYCRSRHVACDKNRPSCGLCIRKSKNCVYPEGPRRSPGVLTPSTTSNSPQSFQGQGHEGYGVLVHPENIQPHMLEHQYPTAAASPAINGSMLSDADLSFEDWLSNEQSKGVGSAEQYVGGTWTAPPAWPSNTLTLPYMPSENPAVGDLEKSTKQGTEQISANLKHPSRHSLPMMHASADSAKEDLWTVPANDFLDRKSSIEPDAFDMAGMICELDPDPRRLLHEPLAPGQPFLCDILDGPCTDCGQKEGHRFECNVGGIYALPCMDCGESGGHNADCHIKNIKPRHVDELTMGQRSLLADASEYFDPEKWRENHHAAPLPPLEGYATKVKGMANVIRAEEDFKKNVELQKISDDELVFFWGFKSMEGVQFLQSDASEPFTFSSYPKDTTSLDAQESDDPNVMDQDEG